jgi:dUTP pyrophosphatase
MEDIIVQFCRTKQEAVLPAKAHDDDAGFDLYAVERYVYLYPNEIVTLDTGFTIAIPDGYVGLVCSRSGLVAKNGIVVHNSPGIIDAGYRGDLKVILYNSSDDVFTVNTGDRIAQLLIQKVLPVRVVEVDKLDYTTTRGEKGIGSTGR